MIYVIVACVKSSVLHLPNIVHPFRNLEQESLPSLSVLWRGSSVTNGLLQVPLSDLLPDHHSPLSITVFTCLLKNCSNSNLMCPLSPHSYSPEFCLHSLAYNSLGSMYSQGLKYLPCLINHTHYISSSILYSTSRFSTVYWTLWHSFHSNNRCNFLSIKFTIPIFLISNNDQRRIYCLSAPNSTFLTALFILGLLFSFANWYWGFLIRSH